ncbi:MAG: hypothetical protein EPN61_05625 [Burkholderiaceae bacterium]|nr:MAG: hypothetical protein EPN61_05625 [Burkholderiaceae bacterium]
MKKKDFELLVSVGDVEVVTITREFLTQSVDPDGTPVGAWMPWEMWIQGGAGVERVGPWIETARNERRGWMKLQTAVDFARDAGWKGLIQLEDRFPPVKSKK